MTLAWFQNHACVNDRLLTHHVLKHKIIAVINKATLQCLYEDFVTPLFNITTNTSNILRVISPHSNVSYFVARKITVTSNAGIQTRWLDF